MNWFHRCESIITFMETQFPEKRYQIVLNHNRDRTLMLTIEVVRSDGGRHDGTAIPFVSVLANDYEKLPNLLHERCLQRLKEYLDEGIKEVTRKFDDLQKARTEVDLRADLLYSLPNER